MIRTGPGRKDRAGRRRPIALPLRGPCQSVDFRSERIQKREVDRDNIGRSNFDERRLLTVQTALGFTLTLATIHLMPPLIDTLGWRFAFMPLAIGPALGVWAMARLRADPRSVALAGGRR